MYVARVRDLSGEAWLGTVGGCDLFHFLLQRLSLVGVKPEQPDHRSKRFGKEVDHRLGEGTVLEIVGQVVGEISALVGRTDRSRRSHQIRTHGCDVSHVEQSSKIMAA